MRKLTAGTAYSRTSLEREAAERAEAKLERIIAREGDANGERRKPYYLQALYEEALREMKAAERLDELYALRRQIERAKPEKEKSRISLVERYTA